MEPSPQTAWPTLSAAHAEAKSPRVAEDKAYQTWTVVAVLMLLASLWLF